MTLKSEEAAAKNWIVKQWNALTPTGKCLAAVFAGLVVIAVWLVFV